MRIQGSGFVLLALGLVSGCDSGKSPVSGIVSYAGDPVVEGLIELVPIEGTPGGSCGTRIADGKYTASGNAAPRRGGVYKVVLRGFRRQMQPDPTNPAQMVEVAQNYLPPDWGEQSTHRIQISTDGSASRYDFEVEPTTETGPGR